MRTRAKGPPIPLQTENAFFDAGTHFDIVVPWEDISAFVPEFCPVAAATS
jgi:hypothetical protein